MLRRSEVLERVDVKKTKLYELIASGDFPAPVPLGRQASQWVEHAVQQWTEARMRDQMPLPLERASAHLGTNGRANPDARGKASPAARSVCAAGGAREACRHEMATAPAAQDRGSAHTDSDPLHATNLARPVAAFRASANRSRGRRVPAERAFGEGAIEGVSDWR